MAKLNLVQKILILVRRFLFACGLFFLVVLLLSFTSLPFWGYYWLGTSQSKVTEKPAYIVLLGGGGMPSESNLIRAYYVCVAAGESPGSKIVISIPGDTANPRSTARLVADELVKKGIDRNKIHYEELGFNTRMQALNLRRLGGEDLTDQPILLITSPEHMRRAVLTFRKAGFKRINALPAFEDALEASLLFKDEDLGGNQLPVPGIGGSLSVRYQFWNHLKYEILIARELAATGYYKLRGWI